jgi:murein DD-endopeptidase MepM/ murein hydrolase activator NlpD
MTISLGSLAAVTLFVSIAYVYMLQHTVTRYRVMTGTEAVGTVSSPDLVWDWLVRKQAAAKEQYPMLQAEVRLNDLRFIEEREYKAAYDNAGTLAALETRLRLQLRAVQIQIEGKPLGFVRDEAAAQELLNQVKLKLSNKSAANKVRILSPAEPAPEAAAPPAVVESAQFMQKVEFVTLDARPEDISQPEELIGKIETGGTQPLKHRVVAGDCISCIAYKYKISQQVIYDNNPWIKNNLIRVGQELDLTVVQPLLSVQTVEKRTERFELPYDTSYIEDASMTAGTRETVAPGQSGLKEVIYLTTRINGEFKEEKAAEEKIIRPSVSAIVRKGTKVTQGVGTGAWVWPVYKAKLTSDFGKRWGSFHPGADMVSDNRAIMASDHGKVVFAGWKSGYGNCIIVDHQNGYSTLYGHLSKIQVKKDKLVQKGEKIGVMGTTGNSTGVHLHFEVRKGEAQLNPLNYLGRLP